MNGGYDNKFYTMRTEYVWTRGKNPDSIRLDTACNGKKMELLLILIYINLVDIKERGYDRLF